MAQLVARYAPLGRRYRRVRAARWAASIIGVPLAALLGYQWLHPVSGPATGPLAGGPPLAGEELRELRELKSLLLAQTSAASELRRAWEEQRALLQRQSAELIQQLGQVAAERQQLEEQRGRLEQAIGRIDAQARELEAQRRLFVQQGPVLEQQMAEIRRQRIELDRQREDFSARGRQLAHELDELTTHRRNLERQQQELQALLERLRAQSDLQSRDRSTRAPAGAATGSDAPEAGPVGQVPDTSGESLMARHAAVGDEVLGEMRGGLDIGGDLEISIGVTRSASINGIEQFTSSAYVEDLTRLANGAVVPVETVVIQNGAGNMVAPEVLQALGGNLGTIIQNSLDGQFIATETVFDVSLNNVSGIMQGIATSETVGEALSLHAH